MADWLIVMQGLRMSKRVQQFFRISTSPPWSGQLEQSQQVPVPTWTHHRTWITNRHLWYSPHRKAERADILRRYGLLVMLAISECTVPIQIFTCVWKQRGRVALSCSLQARGETRPCRPNRQTRWSSLRWQQRAHPSHPLDLGSKLK